MSFEENDANRSLIENMEGKLLDVQSKLRALQEEKNKSQLSPSTTSTSAPSYRAPFRGGRGRFDASFRGRGRGRTGRAANMSLDTRPKTLIISNPPNDFESHAAQHFSK